VPREPVRRDGFSIVTLGPVEWDLAFAGPDGQAAYDVAAARLGLRPLDQRLLRVMESARMLQLVACLALVPQLPVHAEGLRPSLDHWRGTPLAGGLTGRRDHAPANCLSADIDGVKK
jgi:hypothetical protein